MSDCQFLAPILNAKAVSEKYKDMPMSDCQFLAPILNA